MKTDDPGASQTPNPWDLYGGSAGLRLMIVSVAALFGGGLIALAIRDFVLTDQLVGYGLVGLLLLAPLPMLAGDATDALLLAAARRRRLSLEGYRRAAAVAVPGAVVIVGVAVYPVVLAIGGEDLLGVFVVVGALVVFGILPVGGWLIGKLRRRRPEG
jgi:hypothetical protein